MPHSKVAVLALGALHNNPIQFSIVDHLTDFFVAHGKRVAIGFEFPIGKEDSFHEEADFLTTYDQYQQASNRDEKFEAYLKLRDLPPLRSFIKGTSGQTAEKRSERQINAELDFIEHNHAIHNRLRNRLVTEKMSALMDKRKHGSQVTIFSFDDPHLSNQVGLMMLSGKTLGDAAGHIQNGLVLERAAAMAKNITAQIEAKTTDDDSRDCLIILTNLGMLHTKRLHAQIIRNVGEEVLIKSVVLSTPESKEAVNQALKVNAEIVKQEPELADLYKDIDASSGYLELNINPPIEACKDPADPILKSFYEKVAGDIARSFGIASEELKKVDPRAALLAPSAHASHPSAATHEVKSVDHPRT